MKTALSIAGSDSSGGAGIQADLKTMTMNGVYAMSAVTALTAQNTTGVTAILNVPAEFLAKQIDAVFEDIRPDAVKIGMVSSAELIETIAKRLCAHHAVNIVVDPVMIATSGARLIDPAAVSALKETGRQALRLMREFAGAGRLMRMTGEGGRVEMFYFASSDISSDDVVFEAESANANTPAENRSLLYEIYNMGLLSGEDGKVSSDTKRRVLNALGFGGLQNARGLEQLHCDKAAEENLRLAKEDVAADGYDDHALYIAEHIRYLLSGEFKKCGAGAKERFERHISLHREALAAAETADKKDKEN